MCSSTVLTKDAVPSTSGMESRVDKYSGKKAEAMRRRRLAESEEARKDRLAAAAEAKRRKQRAAELKVTMDAVPSKSGMSDPVSKSVDRRMPRLRNKKSSISSASGASHHSAHYEEAGRIGEN